MAIKTAFYGLVVAQVYDWLNCRFFKIRYPAALTHKATAALTVGTAAVVLIGAGGPWLRRMGMNGTAALCATSCAYAVVIVAVVLSWPALAGLTRGQLMHNLRLVLGRAEG
jgi:hypothetical protein